VHWRTIIRALADIRFSKNIDLMPSKPDNCHSALNGSKVELVDTQLLAGAFSPHRHDSYTIAVTTAGVQSFNYRGTLWQSLPGQVLILHPDEVHDGFCCDQHGFSYRAAYLPPAHVQTVMGGAPLPFLASVVSSDLDLVDSAFRLIEICSLRDGSFGYEDALQQLVYAMQRRSEPQATRLIANHEAVMRVREFLDNLPATGTSLGHLEAIAGYDRWQLCRDFRIVLGTSPYRYLQCRRLDRARQLLRDGIGIAAAAHEAGFSDQSHFGRIFRRSVGTTPQAWRKTDHSRTIIL
jgi:AraC-like DNA-binding protein